MDTPARRKTIFNRIVSLFNGFMGGLPAFRWFVCLLGFFTGQALNAEGQVTLPYATDFGPSLGFTRGSLNGQHNWIVLSGSAHITTRVSDLGTQSVVLRAGSPAAMIGLPFSVPWPSQLVYVDCLIKPVASTVASSLINLDTSLVALMRNGSQGQIFVYDGTQWIATPAVFALNSDSTSLDWMRLTFRLDFTAKTWDLYFDETLAAHGVAFNDKTATTLPFFIFQGDPTSPSYLNYLSAGTMNPLGAAAPVFSPAPGSYASAQTVTITSATPGATILYTTDGSTPTTADYSTRTNTNGTLYSGPVAIGSTTRLKAIAYETGFTDSQVTSGLYAIISSPAASLNVFYNFSGLLNGGGEPRGLVEGSDGNFYGVTTDAHRGSYGFVFKLTPEGVLTSLASFNGSPPGNGESPNGPLVQGSDGSFYGTTRGGSNGDHGTVFKVARAGGLTTLVRFFGLNGAYPDAGLVQGSDGNFYGTTSIAGNGGYGTVFKMTPAGVLTTLVEFNSDNNGANGQHPEAGLVQGTDGNFYGTTSAGGSNNPGYGTVFSATPGGVLTTLVSFNLSNGAGSMAGLIQGNDGNFYGTTNNGGSASDGTVFQMTPAGVLTTLVSFYGGNGANPSSGLLQGRDGNFYGTTSAGGSSGYGTIFKMTPAGTLTTLISFDNANGSNPQAALMQGSDGNFYGTTEQGGRYGAGGVAFQLIVPPGL